ncbi:MAG TPA: TadE/TadG family type IV pilus assembly protein [Bradyrhizobium sp.]|uniref:TadE/TadG family type IV pilus assembly protein n=1 Tax=Bradyrhizobium sp. TaxID=376 RepID=UPI002D7E457A|nr:TadE/TadG family type IV pilus assembly protein [Bradyrhizobium sp.]HET7888655.1 TadE/TadG family type IV pilus assembly protein [Bradyrhizobium sp.]
MTRLSFPIRKFWNDAEAVAATEFAIVVPFMLVLYIGGVELADGMAINVKVSATAHSVGDMVTQNTALSTSSMQNILTGATAIIAPYPTISGGTSLMTVTVSEISSDSSGNLTLQWSQSYNGSTFGPGRTSIGANAPYGALSVPASLNGTVGNANNPNNENDQVSFIVSEVSYAYTPNLGSTLPGTINGTVTLADAYWIFPRCSTNSPTNSNGPAYYDVKYGSTLNPSNITCTCVQHLQAKSC